MDVKQAAAVRTQYEARPGRRAIVVTDLADLRGPAHGTVRLPLRLYWSGPARRSTLMTRTCAAGCMRLSCAKRRTPRS